MKKNFIRDEAGVGAIEFGLIAPVIGVMFLGVISAWSYMRQDSNMRDAVEAAAKYYVQGGSSDSQALAIAQAAWSVVPKGGTMNVTRSCSCAGASVACGTGVICSDKSIPQVAVLVSAQSNWVDPYSSNIFPNGLALNESETIRIR
ncbi:MAG: pilus assembly protein [Alphaproteobacteria bacterium]|nr:pilus assembly protein [Alphaproteobacteria bacterium]